MTKMAGKSAAIGTLVVVGLALSTGAKAHEADAKNSLKAMSDYMAKQTTISFGYDSSLEVVTKDHQKIMLANSGTIEISRPDKIRMSRDGGFSAVEMIFDGRTLTILHRDANVYAQADEPGTLDHLVDELRDKFHKPTPGADLLLSNVYDQLMDGVTDIKDLGSGVIGGKECDHFAFRTPDTDWQIWIAQGDRPYPCRYVITSKQIDQAPQYSVQVRDWKTGSEVAADRFAFTNSTNARKVVVTDLGDADELAGQFIPGGSP
jgi:hypothetical protein